MVSIFIEIGIIIIIATTLGYILKLLKQPMIPAYVIAGLLIGPIFGLLPNDAVIATLSDIGIAFLLFIVGLEINFKKLKDVGVVATVGGAINSTLLFALGAIVAIVLKFGRTDALYLGLVVAFSSTMVVIKVLSDKRELDTLHGRILVGILLMEDVMSIIILSALSKGSLLLSIGKFAGLLAAAYLLARYVLPRLFANAARHPELLFLLSLSLCFAFSLAALGLGISVVIGAFIAGITIANLPYRIEIISRVRPLRDFFATIFFVSLGMQLSLPSVGKLIVPFLVFFSLITFVKPFMLMNIITQFGYKRKVAVLSGISLAQISEFALIITALGKSLGHISDSVFTLAIMIAVSTITASSYFLKYDSKIYHALAPHLGFLDKQIEGTADNFDLDSEKKKDVIVCGYNRIGFNIVNSLKSSNKNFLVVDYNPDVIKQLSDKGIPCMYGDVGDVDVIERMELAEASMVISTIPDPTDTILLIKKTRESNKSAALIVTASQLGEALHFYNQGADYVVLPHFLGGEHVSKLIGEFHADPVNIISERMRHIEELQTREELGQEHPSHE